MRYYIAGKMTGEVDFGYPKFFVAAEILKTLGHESENPADNDGPNVHIAVENAARYKAAGKTWGDYMRRDMPRIATCDGIVVLPGWQKSRGASLEVDIATRIGMPILCLLRGIAYNGGPDNSDAYQLVPRIRAIGLSGYARSGKDTVGQILVEKHGYRRASFADKLKELALLVNPIIGNDGVALLDMVELYGWESAKDAHPEVRRLLQAIGTGVRDIVGPNTWVDLAMRNLPDGSKVVFTDCRFPSEADAIRAAGGTLWRIERPGFGPVNGHISETALDDHEFNVVIPNKYTLDFLDGLVRLALDIDAKNAVRA